MNSIKRSSAPSQKNLCKPNLLFLHGFLGSLEDWGEVTDVLKAKYNCYFLELPGHGKVAADADIETLFLHFLHTHGLSSCILVGYSMGGRLAIYLQQKQKDKIEKLILISAHLGIKNEEERLERAESDRKWKEKLEQEPFELFLEQWYNQPLFHSLRKLASFPKTLKRRAQLQPQALSYVLEKYSLKWHPYILPQNAAFICGRNDLKYVNHYRTLPTSTVHIVEDCGHAVHLENPKACAEAIHAIMCGN